MSRCPRAQQSTAPTCVCIASATNNFRRCPMITEDGNVSSKSSRARSRCAAHGTVLRIIACRFSRARKISRGWWATAGRDVGLTGGVTTDVGLEARLQLKHSAMGTTTAACATCRLQIRRTAGKEARRGRERKAEVVGGAMKAGSAPSRCAWVLRRRPPPQACVRDGQARVTMLARASFTGP